MKQLNATSRGSKHVNMIPDAKTSKDVIPDNSTEMPKRNGGTKVWYQIRESNLESTTATK